jgi:hypothetical protein
LVLSGARADVILENDAIDIVALTPENVEIYAFLLKEGKETEIHYARPWIELDQNLYFFLVQKVPQEIWERYPVNRDFYDIITWITTLPENQQKEKWELPSWKVEQDFKKFMEKIDNFHQ